MAALTNELARPLAAVMRGRAACARLHGSTGGTTRLIRTCAAQSNTSSASALSSSSLAVAHHAPDHRGTLQRSAPCCQSIKRCSLSTFLPLHPPSLPIISRIRCLTGAAALACDKRSFSISKIAYNNARPFQAPLCSLMTSSAAQSSAPRRAPGWDPSKTPFPPVRRADTTISFKSTANDGKEVQVPDPYNYLEVPPSQSAETKAFCDAQANFTKLYLDQVRDEEQEVRQMIDKAINYPRFSVPIPQGPYDSPAYYYVHNKGLDAQPSWYVATKEELNTAEMDGYKGPAGKVFFDVTLMSKSGTVSVKNIYFSTSGKIAAYAVSKAGSDWDTIYFRETSKPFVSAPADEASAACGGPDRLPDCLKNVKFSGVSWTADDKGVFYQRLAHTEGQDEGTEIELAAHAEIFYHRMGTSQDEDVLVVPKDPERSTNMWGAEVTEDGKWLVLNSYKGTEQKSRTYIAPLDQPISTHMKWISVAPEFRYSLQIVANDGNDFYCLTNHNAANWKIVRFRADASTAKACGHVTELTEEVAFEDIIKEDKEATLDSATVVNLNKLLVTYVRNVKNELYQYELKTGKRVQRIVPDLMGTMSSLSGRFYDKEAFLTATSFTTPGLTYRLTWTDKGKDPVAVPTVMLHRATRVGGVDLNAFETRQVFVPSKDGVKVPVYLTYAKDTPMDGTAPAWLYFYGGFAHSLLPAFSPRLLTWIRSYGGVLVWVSARGGSEYGEEWHDGATFYNKGNTFADVLAAAEYVVEEKIAAKGKIIVNGGSNGGMGAMAVGNQAPEGLLGAVVAEVGVHDMLRFNLFTAGAYWTQEYGDPQDAAMFDYLYKYSPLHNVRTDKTYPFVLLTTADHDDRVSPLHSFKMIAELQHQLPNNANPLLLHVTTDAGHGASNSLTKTLQDAAIKDVLVAHALGLKRRNKPAKASI